VGLEEGGEESLGINLLYTQLLYVGGYASKVYMKIKMKMCWAGVLGKVMSEDKFRIKSVCFSALLGRKNGQ